MRTASAAHLISSQAMLLLICVCFVWPIGEVQAVSSRLCLKVMHRLQRAVDSGRVAKCRPLCGSLDTNTYHQSFMDRLSPSCRVVMSRYKAGNRPAHAVSSKRSQTPSSSRKFPTVDACRHLKQASSATNPVVVEVAGAVNFALCTVPKAGCTLLRSLLYVLTRDTQDSVTFRNSIVHHAQYPTALHYHYQSELPDTYPTFVVGRNPYIRLVSGLLSKFSSGFLDKMVVTSQSHDWVVMERVNTDLGVPRHTSFRATKESFASFVHLLNNATHRNPHFEPAVNVCYMTKFPYRYMLRIEDMSEWFPCWSSGLWLDQYTQFGWTRSNDGHTTFNKSGTSCWWSPEQTSCQEYHFKTHNDHGDAIVPDSWKAAATTHAHDAHDTRAAERWMTFYDQEIADIAFNIYKQDFDTFQYDRLVF